MKEIPCIEPLEARIAPAILISPTEVTYLDNNGETAVVKISKPLFTSAAAAAKILVFTDTSNAASPFASTGNQNLLQINLLGPNGTALKAAQDMNISVSLIPQKDGPHTVNIGHIDAAVFDPTTGKASQNIDLGKITIQGDVNYINAGDNFVTPAVKSLNVLSMVQGGTSTFLGPLASFHDSGNFGSFLNVAGGPSGGIGKLNIEGADTGIIQFSGHIGTAVIASMTGSSFNGGGSLLGFAGATSSIGSLHVLGSVTGGSGFATGEIYAGAKIGKIVIDGSLQGGGTTTTTTTAGAESGSIQDGGTTTTTTTAVAESGYIQGGRIESLKIGGNVSTFANSTGGAVSNNGSIRATANIDSLEIDGNVTGVSGDVAYISAAHGASTSKHAKSDVALGKVTIKGSVSYLDILAGYGADTSTTTGTGTNAVTNPEGAPLGNMADGTAQIGTISIGGTLSASNIVAGVAPNSSGYFGAAGDAAISGTDNKVGLHSSIAKIVVGGMAAGDGTSTGSFGIVAQKLPSISIDQTVLGSLTPGAPRQINGNLYALEIT